ncbi:MAG TPA: AsmA family protein [Bryobacteraceae bacterium]|nr:AsmA family protein [Bryobacteraceae bacterium]
MRKIVRFAGIAVVLLLLAAAGLALLLDINQFRPMLEYSLSTSLGRDVKAGNLRLALFSGGVSAADVTIADDPAFGKSPFLRAKSFKLAVELQPLLFSKKLNVTGLTIDEPEIVLLQSDSGDWNFSTLGAKPAQNPPPAAAEPPGKAGLDLLVKLVRINGGRVSIGNDDSGSKPLILEKMNIELRDYSPTSVFPFTLAAEVSGGGSLQLTGRAGPIHPADASLTPVEASLRIHRLDLERSGMSGATGMAGLITVDGSGASDGAGLRIQGQLTGEQLKLARNGSPAQRPVVFDFAVEHDMKKRSGRLSRGDIRIGAAPARLTGSYSQNRDSMSVNMTLTGPAMPVPELAGLLPAFGIVLPSGSSLQGGTASAKLASTGPIGQLVTTGALSLNDTRLTGFDLGGKLSAAARLAGIQAGRDTEIQTLSAKVRVASGGTRAEELLLIAPAIGELTGAGTVSANHELDFKMRAKVRTSGKVMAALGQSGDTAVPFLVGGTAAEPVFRPDLKEMASQKIKGLKEGGIGKKAGNLLNGLFGRNKRKDR